MKSALIAAAPSPARGDEVVIRPGLELPYHGRGGSQQYSTSSPQLSERVLVVPPIRVVVGER
eukprot:3114375-Rhodomonas_salina.1